MKNAILIVVLMAFFQVQLQNFVFLIHLYSYIHKLYPFW